MNYKDNVVSMLDLSTAHLCEKTREWLMNEDTEPITVYEKGDYGWFVVIPSEYQIDKHNRLFTAVPEDLKNVMGLRFEYRLSMDHV